jgi:hypothetical protein
MKVSYRDGSVEPIPVMSMKKFIELCLSIFAPLLIIKMLPMKTFDALNSPVMYGHLSQNKMHGMYSCLAYLPFGFLFVFNTITYFKVCFAFGYLFSRAYLY